MRLDPNFIPYTKTQNRLDFNQGAKIIKLLEDDTEESLRTLDSACFGYGTKR